MDIPGAILLWLGALAYLFLPPDNLYDDRIVDGYSLTAFGSKTAYANNGLRSEHKSYVDDERIIQVSALYRHGTRSPDDKFSKKAKKYKSLLEPLFPDWNFPMNSIGKGDRILLSTGIAELKGMGYRMRKLLPKKFHKDSYTRVFSSDTQRTRASAKAFLSKFLKDKIDIEIDQERIRFYDYCNDYIKDVESNENSRAEYDKFKNGPEMKTVLAEVVSDHNLESLNFTTSDIANLYKIASYEVSVMDENSKLPGWIKLFRPMHLYVLEYLNDLKQYWTKAHGFPINYEQVCPLWGQMLTDMQYAADYDILSIKAERTDNKKLIKKKSKPYKSVFWFGHAETVLPLIAKLGMFNESIASKYGNGSHLTADGFKTRLRKLSSADPPVTNLFRSSHIIPFGSNVAFFVFRCSKNNKAQPSLDDYCVEARVNEQVIEMLPLEKDEPRPLSLSFLLKYFKGCLPENYNHKLVCGVRRSTKNKADDD